MQNHVFSSENALLGSTLYDTKPSACDIFLHKTYRKTGGDS